MTRSTQILLSSVALLALITVGAASTMRSAPGESRAYLHSYNLPSSGIALVILPGPTAWSKSPTVLVFSGSHWIPHNARSLTMNMNYRKPRKPKQRDLEAEREDYLCLLPHTD